MTPNYNDLIRQRRSNRHPRRPGSQQATRPITTTSPSQPTAAPGEKANDNGLPSSEFPITRSRTSVRGSASSTPKKALIQGNRQPLGQHQPPQQLTAPAPIERRMPISRERSSTLRAIVLASPNPPTSAVSPARDINSTTR